METTFNVRPSVCFEVQKITAVSIGEGNQRNYQVQWAPTWISSIHLVGCEQLIEEFISQQSRKGQGTNDRSGTTDAGAPFLHTTDADAPFLHTTDADAPLVDTADADVPFVDTTENVFGDSYVPDLTSNHQKGGSYKQTCLPPDNGNIFENVIGSGVTYVSVEEVSMETNVYRSIQTDSISKQVSGSTEDTCIGGVNIEDHSVSMCTQGANTSGYIKEECDDWDLSVGQCNVLDCSEEVHRENVEAGDQFQGVVEVKVEEVPVTESNELTIESNEPIIESNEAIIESNEPIMESNEPVMESNEPIIESNEPIIESNEPTIERNETATEGNQTSLLNILLKTPIKTYKCNICHAVFKSKSWLISHSNKMHVNVAMFKCDICDMNFQSKAPLHMHKLEHAAEKGNVCHVCSKVFLEKDRLQEHLLTHTRLLVHQCSICEKMFTSSSKLKRHERIHTDERPYVCEVCQKAFQRKDHLKSHVQTHNRTKFYKFL